LLIDNWWWVVQVVDLRVDVICLQVVKLITKDKTKEADKKLAEAPTKTQARQNCNAFNELAKKRASELATQTFSCGGRALTQEVLIALPP
jgi:predicted xylose isomerase-like sugar epimerase